MQIIKNRERIMKTRGMGGGGGVTKLAPNRSLGCLTRNNTILKVGLRLCEYKDGMGSPARVVGLKIVFLIPIVTVVQALGR